VSNFGDVPAAILKVIDNAITLGGSRDGFISYAKIPPGEFPYAMIYDPVKEIDRGEFQHGVETTANPVLVVWFDETIDNVNKAVGLIEAEIASDPTLDGVVEDAWVAVVGRDEGLDSKHTAAVFQINTLGTV